jgi:membrane protein
LPPEANEEPMAGTDGRRTSTWLVTQQWWRVFKISSMRHFTSGGHFMAAAIAFYALIALAPLGMLLAAMLQRLFESVAVSDAAYRNLEALIGEWAGGATNHIMDLVRSQAESQNRIGGGTLTANLLSAGIFVWTGLRLFDIIQISLGTIWPGRRVRGVVFRKLVSLAMMLVSGLLFVTVIFLLSTRGAINEWLSRLEGPNIPLVVPHSLVAFGIGLAISTIAYLLLYKFMPVQQVSTRAAFAGALFAAVIWQGLSPIFTRFIALSQYFHTVFETLLWVIIFGLWAFWGAQIMLFGAQFVAAFEHVFVQRRPRGEDDALVDVTRRRTQTYVGDMDAEAERIIEELQLNREPAACALDAAGNKLINGIILGGGKISHLFAERVGTDIKGLIKVDGRASVEYVAAAMRAVPGMGKIVLVGDKAAFLHHPVAAQVDGIIDEGPDIWHNLMRAVRYLNEDKRILLSTSDTPLLTAEALCSFLGQCDADADLCVPVTPKLPTKELFGNRVWVYLPLREGWITHTSNVLFDPRLLLRNQDFAERFLSRRKDLWGAAGTLGLRFTGRFFFSWIFPFLRYDMPGMAHQIEVMLGARKCQGVMLDYPEIALDIDRPSDVDEIEAFIQREKQAGRWQTSME